MKAFFAVALTASVLGAGVFSTSASAMNLTSAGGGHPGGGNPGGGSHGAEAMNFANTCDFKMFQKKLVNGKKIWIKKCDYIR